MKVTNDFTLSYLQYNNNTICMLDVYNALLIIVTHHILGMTVLTLVLEISMNLHFHVVCHFLVFMKFLSLARMVVWWLG